MNRTLFAAMIPGHLAARALTLTVVVVLAGCDLFTSTETRMQRADELMMAQDYRAAVIELKNVVQKDPRNAQAHSMMAKAAFRLGDPQAADDELKRALESGAPAAELAELRAQVQLALSRYAELLAQLDKGEIVVSEPMQSIYRAEALAGMKRYAEAITILEAVLAAEPNSTAAKITMVEARIGSGELQRALDELKALTTQHPKHSYAWLLQGAILAQRGQFDEAERALLTARNDEASLTLQQQARLLATLTQTYLAQGDVEAADKAQAALKATAGVAPVTRMLAARILMARQDYQEASAELHRLLQAAPDFLPGRFLLGSVLLAQGSLEQAEVQLVQVVQKAPENLEARKLLAMVRLQLGHPDAAMQILVPAVDDEGTDAQLKSLFGAAQVGMAQMAARRGDVASAIAQLEKTSREDPKAIEPRLGLARLYLQTKQTQKADALIAAVLAQEPKRADVFNGIGVVFMDAGRYDQALARFRGAAELEPGNAGYWLNAGRAQLALNQPAAARESIEQAMKLRPDWLPAVATAALLDLRSNDRQAAVERVVALKGKNPKDPQVLLLEGEMRAAAGQYADAAKAFDAVTQIKPNRLSALKSYRARHIGKLSNATEPLQRWLAGNPEDAVVRSALAEAHALQGDSSLAIQEYERVLKQVPNSPAVLNNLAWQYYEAKDARALPTAKRAYELGPSFAAISDTYGWILVENGKVTEGAEILRKALQVSKDPEIEYHHAVALARSGAHQEARQKLAALVARPGGFPSIAAAKRQLAELDGK